jgi:hypothetical protein
MTAAAAPAFDLAVLTETAVASTGLDDFGDRSFREPLEVVARSLDTEAGLSAAGRAGQSSALLGHLITRLQVESWIRRYPEILEETIAAPILIVGLPRTGTTMLYRMLSVARGLSAPLHYEVRDPVPPVGWDFRCATDPRVAAAEESIRLMNDAAPGLASIYPFEALAPEEDIFLTDRSFRSTGFHSVARVPAYEEWFAAADKTPAYRYLGRCLRLLQWQRARSDPQAPPGRWLLKSPDHLHSLQELFSVFPDALVIQTHRDPLRTIPSICSFIKTLHEMSCATVDAAGIGRAWSEMFARSMSGALAARGQRQDRFLDVWYEDTVTRPHAVAEEVFSFIGSALDEDARREMGRWRDANRREARPSHRYTLEEFGLAEDRIASLFAPYREAFVLGRPAAQQGP